MEERVRFLKAMKPELTESDVDLWAKVMERGRKLERGVVHQMSREQVWAIIDMFKFNPVFQHQLEFDFIKAGYKLFDEVAMWVQGRTKGYSVTPDVERMTVDQANRLAAVFVSCADRSKTKGELYDCFVREGREDNSYGREPPKILQEAKRVA